MTDIHSFHIPVMGTGFTIDSPVQVAKYGISSVISLVDDALIEKMRAYYSKEIGKKYVPIDKNEEDSRARRITAYLNLLDEIVQAKFKEIKESKFQDGSEINKYFDFLPSDSLLKISYQEMLKEKDKEKKLALQDALRERMRPGSIDVNIMTKLDKVNHDKESKKELPQEFSDALSALRGYAKSKLSSAIIFSAGLNRYLYTYVEKFEDFYANASGFIKKKIVLKVTDYRSSLIQGKIFAKKGLWVSEYRIESGLNCGGHAFPSNGILMGPILEEFKTKKDELIATIFKSYKKALESKNKTIFEKPHEMLVTAQGGITTSNENKFLLNDYNVDATGWGTPFLLVPEAASVDEGTLKKISEAAEEDLSLSQVSPLGVPFNNLINSFSEIKKKLRNQEGHPGSPCPKGHLSFNTEFTDHPICVASRQYQKLKIEQLQSQNLKEDKFRKAYDKIIEKSCICHDLGASALLKYKIVKENSNAFPAICPGPSIAYFSKISTLAEMIGHIYGRLNLLTRKEHPNMFIKEAQIMLEHFILDVKKCTVTPTEKQIQALNEIKSNLVKSIEYYFHLFPKMIQETQEYREKALFQLQEFKEKLNTFVEDHAHIFSSIPEAT